MNLLEEKDFRIECGKLAVDIAFARLGLVKDEISQREASRLYGRGKVKSWVNAGYIQRVKLGAGNSKATYSRIELETLKNLEAKHKLK